MEDSVADSIKFSIRTANAEDTDAMVRIALLAWRPVFESFRENMGDKLFDTAYVDWRADKGNQIRSAASSESTVSFLVAESEGRIAGFVSWVTRDSDGVAIAEIGNNAVDPDCQNNGIATTLYGEVIRRCREAGVAAIKVNTGLDPSHAPARRAYEKAGFGNGIPMVTYWQDLG
jgi:GNAT superfamily N-acetyltransferase